MNVRNVFLDQSTSEIMTKVHVLSGLSVKVVTFEFIVRELSIFFYKTTKELIQMYHYSNNS